MTPEERNAYARRWRENNKEKVKESSRRWLEKNKEYTKDYYKNNIDHFVPLAKGGKHEFKNLRLSCPKCNRLKGAKDPYEFIKQIRTA